MHRPRLYRKPKHWGILPSVDYKQMQTVKTGWQFSHDLNLVDTTHFEILELVSETYGKPFYFILSGWVLSPTLSLASTSKLSYLPMVWLFILFYLFFSTCIVLISIFFISFILLVEFLIIPNCIWVSWDSFFHRYSYFLLWVVSNSHEPKVHWPSNSMIIGILYHNEVYDYFLYISRHQHSALCTSLQGLLIRKIGILTI